MTFRWRTRFLLHGALSRHETEGRLKTGCLRVRIVLPISRQDACTPVALLPGTFPPVVVLRSVGLQIARGCSRRLP